MLIEEVLFGATPRIFCLQVCIDLFRFFRMCLPSKLGINLIKVRPCRADLILSNYLVRQRNHQLTVAQADKDFTFVLIFQRTMLAIWLLYFKAFQLLLFQCLVGMLQFSPDSNGQWEDIRTCINKFNSSFYKFG